MTGNTLTMNPITGTNAYTNSAFGTPQQGFWGTTGGFGGTTPFGFTTTPFQTQVPNLFNQTYGTYGTVNPLVTGQTFQTPGMVGQPTNNWWQTGFTTPQFGTLGIQNPILNTIQQTTPQQVLNTILQTTPPQVLPYILNALACQQACQQVLQQNPQVLQTIQPQAITQPFLGFTQPFVNPLAQVGFGTQTPVTGFLPQFQQGSCVGCTPGIQGLYGQYQPQQPWFGTTYGTW